MQSVVMQMVVYGECRKQAHYPDCHYAECRYAECRGAAQTGAPLW